MGRTLRLPRSPVLKTILWSLGVMVGLAIVFTLAMFTFITVMELLG